jgi:hypothetical protein
MEHVRDGAARRDSIDGDFLFATVFGQHRNKRLDCAFGTGIHRVLGHKETTGGVGAGQDDTTTGLQILVRFTSDKELATGVNTEHTIELLL